MSLWNFKMGEGKILASKIEPEYSEYTSKVAAQLCRETMRIEEMDILNKMDISSLERMKISIENALTNKRMLAAKNVAK